MSGISSLTMWALIKMARSTLATSMFSTIFRLLFNISKPQLPFLQSTGRCHHFSVLLRKLSQIPSWEESSQGEVLWPSIPVHQNHLPGLWSPNVDALLMRTACHLALLEATAPSIQITICPGLTVAQRGVIWATFRGSDKLCMCCFWLVSVFPCSAVHFTLFEFHPIFLSLLFPAYLFPSNILIMA